MSSSSHIDDNNPRLTPLDEKFSYPEKLKRSEMDGLDASQWEELCIAASEGEQDCIDSLPNNDDFKKEVEKYKSLKLKASQQISYPSKNSLKKSSTKIGLWISIAAAAIALFIATTIIMRNTSPETETPQVATTSTMPKQNQPSAQNDIDKDNNLQKNNPTIVQPKNVVAQSESTTKVNNIPIVKKQPVEHKELLQDTRREGLGLKPIETPQSPTLAVNTTDNAKLLAPIGQDVIIYASADEIGQIEIEKPNFFDRLREKSIVRVNSLLGKSTVVVREYDSDGKLTLYAVQSSTLNFERNYTE